MECRHCKEVLNDELINLGISPPSNSYLLSSELFQPEKQYPLKVLICKKCRLVQTEDHVSEKEFFSDDYAYFSSVSKSWVEHAKCYSKSITKKLYLNPNSFVIEIASNDGYLLRNFKDMDIPCLGIEPTKSTSREAAKLKIPQLNEFFGLQCAQSLIKKMGKADLVIGNNVYAHVPDINDFTKGLKTILKEEGTITLEFPHLLNLIKYNQFDTIYHEHFSYLSLTAVINIFLKYQLRVYDVEELDTHGGSLRVYACHENSKNSPTNNVDTIIRKEKEFGLFENSTLESFRTNCYKIKEKIRSFLLECRDKNMSVAGYGAAAKGNTLLNFASITAELLPVVYDAAVSKQNKYLPGSRIPIKNPIDIANVNFDYLVIFPWNIKNEIIKICRDKYNFKGKFVVFVPDYEEL